MDISKEIEAYERYLLSELATRTSYENKMTMLKYEIRVNSGVAPRVILNDIKALVAEKYMIDIENMAIKELKASKKQ